MKNLKILTFLTLFVLLVGTLFAQETAPAEEPKPADQPATAEEQKPAEQQPAKAEEQKPAEQQPAKAEEQKPAEQQAAAEEQKPAEQQAAAEEPKTAEQQAAAEEKPAEQQAAAAEEKPAEQQAAAAEEKPAEQQAAAAEEKPAEEAVAKKDDSNDRRIREIEKTFWKGEVANIGANEIISPYNSAGLAAGVKFMDDELYLVITPKFSMHFDKLIKEPVSEKELDLIFGLHAPFNIRVLSTDINSNDGKVRFRTEDWDEWQDYLKILRYLQIGTSEDNLYLSIGSNFAQTIGHGTILKRYIPNHDSTFSTMSAKLNWYFDYGGFEALLGDVARGNIFGGLVFLKPFSAIGNYHARSVSFGYSFVADRNAPTKLRYEKYYDYDANDYLNGTDSRVPRIAVDSKGRPIIEDDEFLYMQGIDFELKLFKNEKVDIKAFTDYSWFKKDFVKGGFTFGFLGRFNLDQKNQHAIRIQLEGRAHHDSYIPSFFDTFYDIERIEMMTNIFGAKNFQPDGRSKYWHLMNDSDDKFVGSFYGELSYSFRTWIALSVGYEKLPDSSSIFAHLELPDLWILKMMVSYYKRGFGSAKELFSDSHVSSLFRGVVRLQILPFLYINGYAGKHWTFWNAKNPRPHDNLEGHYVSSWDLGGDVEFGWEWGRSGKEDKKADKKADKKEEKK
ncbi:hypothetical protein IKO70_05605 [bacterium]|nr:hypothetical protein [bacterium]